MRHYGFDNLPINFDSRWDGFNSRAARWNATDLKIFTIFTTEDDPETERGLRQRQIKKGRGRWKEAWVQTAPLTKVAGGDAVRQSRPMVVCDTPNVRAMSASVSPASRRALASCCWSWLSFAGLPMCWPRALALALPSLVRSLIRCLSNSARPPRTVRMSLPCGVVVSAQVSASDLKPAPFFVMASSVFNRSRVLRASLSSRVVMRRRFTAESGERSTKCRVRT